MLDEISMRTDLRSVNEFLERRSRWMYSPKKTTEERPKEDCPNCMGCDDYPTCPVYLSLGF
jgi:hypothetical protein